MSMTAAPLSLGKVIGDQVSVQDYVDEESIFNIFFKEEKKINEILEKNKSKFIKELWNRFFIEKSFKFTLNKQNEIYIKHHKSDLDQIFRYVNFRYLFHLAGSQKIDLGYPPYILIEPVSTCNLRCPFCYQTDKTFTKKPYMGVMKIELFKKVIDQADLLGTGAITIASRGEPTLHKDLKEMLQYLNTKKNIMEKKLNTNGTFLTEEICHSIFKSNLTQVVISSDHYEKKEYERLRLGSNFESVVKNADMLFNIRKKYYPKSLTEIRISGINNDRNLDKEKFKNFWIKRSDHVTVGLPLERWDTYNNDIHPKINDPCENLWDRMYVWFDGKVNPCDSDYKSYLSYGNANDSNLKDIWENNIIKKLRNDHVSNNRNKIDPCNKCGITFTT